MAESAVSRGERSASPGVEIPEWLRGSGMECFTTPHLPGFQADIKTIPDDFVVTEIDSSGQLVQLDPPSPPNHTHPVSTSHAPNLLSLSVPTTDEGVSLDDESLSISVPTTSTGSEGVPLEDSLITEEEQSAAADSSSSESRPETTAVGSSSSERGKMVKSRPDISSVPPLSELINEEQYKALSEMAEKLKTTLDPQLGENICLGEIPDRERRGFVHNAVRLAFPVLKTKATRNEAGVSRIFVLVDPNYLPLRELLGEEDAERLLVFVNVPQPSRKLTLQPDSSKEHRQEVHHKLNDLYGRILSSSTHTHQHWSSRKRRKREDGSAESAKAGEQPPSRIVLQFRGSPPGKMKKVEKQIYTKFVLRKTNQESLEVIHKLSEALNCQPSRFSICGIKDKKAITTQLASVRGIAPQKLHLVANDPTLSGIAVGNYKLTDHPVVLGEHSGNHFKIVLRNVRPGHVTSDDVTHRSYQSMGSDGEAGHMTSDDITAVDHQTMEGICNQTGHMTSDKVATSIKTSSDVTVQDASHMTSDDVIPFLPQAIEEIRDTGFINYFGPQRLGSSGTSSLVSLAILKKELKAAVDFIISTIYEKDSEALKEAKRYFIATHDIAGTLKKIQHRHSRESLILRSLHRYGYTHDGCKRALMTFPHDWRTFLAHNFSSLVFNHLATYRVREYGLRPVEGDLVLKKVDDPSRLLTLRDCVHVLTRHEINSGQYSLGDVVLPLLGTKSVLPSNKVADKVKEILCAVGITLASFRINTLRMHLPGSYRRLIVYPKQLSWRWVPPNELATSSTFRDSIGRGPGAAMLSQREREGRKTAAPAVELSFSLETNCFATVLLREIMKQ